MSQVITLTANPAIDISTSVGRIAPFSKLRCAPPRRHPGGGGINVARVIKRLGGDVAAIYPCGGTSGQMLRRLLDAEEVESLPVAAAEETREDFTVFEETTKRQYRFVLPGAPLGEKEWQQCLATLANVTPPPAFIVASGSLPPGVPDDFFGRVVDIARGMGAKAVVDTSGRPLAAALKAGCHLIKPNLREFRDLTGVEASDDAALIEAGRDLIAQNRVQVIALTLGPGGALLIAPDGALRADALPIEPASVVGAGDSFVAATVFSLLRGDGYEAALRYGVAAGSAALLNPGTELSLAEDILHLAPQVKVRPA